jgi:hypothetical protein
MPNAAASGQASGDPFAFLLPSIAITADDRRRMDGGGAVAESLPANPGDLAVVAAVATRADAERVAAWIRQIDALKRSPYVTAIARFSDPPRLADVAGLALPAVDLEALRRCRPGRCAVKLADTEVARLQRVSGAGDEAVRAEFRRIIVERATAYLQDGADSVAGFRPRQASLIAQFPFLRQRFPAFTDRLAAYPHADGVALETFLYWAEERLAGKPVVSIYDVVLTRPAAPGLPVLLVASTQVFASHYVDAAFALTMLVPSPTADRFYLVYANRTATDTLTGMFGALARQVARRRVRHEAREVLEGLRTRIESGPPLR